MLNNNQFVATVFLLFVTTLVIIAIPTKAEIINITNGSLEINITKENLNDSGHDFINRTGAISQQIQADGKEYINKVPDKVTIKTPGFIFIENLIIFVIAVIVLRR